MAVFLVSGFLHAVYYNAWQTAFLVASAYVECFIGLLIVYTSRKAPNLIEAEKRIIIGLAVFMLGFISLQLMLKQTMENLNINQFI